MKLLGLLLLLFAGLPPYASAIDPGRVQGFLQVNDTAMALTQAYAHLHDNAEGLLDRPQELRLLLADREVPPEALAGFAPLAAEQMAREGRLQGLLLKLDPNDHQRLEVTLLYPPAEPGQPFMTQTLRTTVGKAPIELKIGANRVGGAVEHHDERQGETGGRPKLAYGLRFSAPLFHEMAVTAVLVGPAAQNSPQMRVLREQARALEKGDFESVQRLSTEGAHRRRRAFLAQAGPEPGSWAKQAAAELRDSARRLKRVVWRGDHAVAVFAGKRWQSFVRQGGEWKSDN